jgi:hypothetical protein
MGITGRAGISGKKPALILEEVEKLRLYDEPEKNLVFVDDGLARGAAVMARCMNSMGTPNNPLGGVRHDRCILKERMNHESNKGQPPILKSVRPLEKPRAYYKGGQP